jgi:catechol-2,3-dioxygenase
MIEITAIHLQGGEYHQHIANVKWRQTSTSETGQSTRQAVVNWLQESKTNQAVVANAGTWVYVGVVTQGPGAPYLRTHADGVWNDNLLALPKY